MMVSKSLAGAAVALLCAGPALANQDVESDLAAMQEQMKVLQQQVEAQQEQLEQQGEQLEDAQKIVRRTQEETKAVSGLAKFLETVEINGSVAGSYFWNFNNPDLSADPNNPPAGVGGNQGFNGQYYPFHPDHNSFQVDQVWFGLAKTATDESRAGFGFDMLFGQTASSMKAASGGLLTGDGSIVTDRSFGDSVSDLYVHQAYVEYLAPIGDGLNVKFGKYATMVGAELLDTTQNFNISYGVLFNEFQPVDHVGILLTQSVGPAEISFGASNGNTVLNDAPDWNKSKSMQVSAAMIQDKYSGRVTVLYGTESFNDNSTKFGLVDIVGTFDPSDTLSMWVNADYGWEAGSGLSKWGVAAAGRQALGDRTGVSLRAEYANEQGLNENALGLGDGSCMGGTACLAEVWGLTGTVDHELVEGLIVKGEVRYDQVSIRGTDEFIDGRATTGANFTSRKQQVTIGAQVAYIF